MALKYEVLWKEFCIGIHKSFTKLWAANQNVWLETKAFKYSFLSLKLKPISLFPLTPGSSEQNGHTHETNSNTSLTYKTLKTKTPQTLNITLKFRTEESEEKSHQGILLYERIKPNNNTSESWVYSIKNKNFRNLMNTDRNLPVS